MATLLESCNNFFEQFTLSVLRKGKVPRHVGFILDGNRRFARKAGANSTKFGHYEGFRQLEKVRWERERCVYVEATDTHAVEKKKGFGFVHAIRD